MVYGPQMFIITDMLYLKTVKGVQCTVCKKDSAPSISPVCIWKRVFSRVLYTLPIYLFYTIVFVLSATVIVRHLYIAYRFIFYNWWHIYIICVNKHLSIHYWDLRVSSLWIAQLYVKYIRHSWGNHTVSIIQGSMNFLRQDKANTEINVYSSSISILRRYTGRFEPKYII